LCGSPSSLDGCTSDVNSQTNNVYWLSSAAYSYIE
jgi:hypothetical protein